MTVDLLDYDSAMVELESGKHCLCSYPLAQLSETGDGVVNTSYLDDSIVKGLAYYGGTVKTVTAGTTEYYVIDPTACDCNPFKLPIDVSCSAGFATVKLYENTDYTIGTAITLHNRNRASEKVAKILMGNATVVTDKGTELPPLLFGTASTRQSAGGGGGTGSNSIILNSNYKYLVEVTYSAACTVCGRVEIVEV